MTRDDFPALAAWLRAPHVEAWFPWVHGETDERGDLAATEAEYGPCIDGSDPTELFVIEVDGQPVGFIQRYRISDNPSWAAALSAAGESGAAAGESGAAAGESGAAAGESGAAAGDTSAAARFDSAVGFDYAIGVLEATGRGVGSEAIRQLVADTFGRYPDVDSIVVAMQQANRASWRALEHVGFERRWAGLLDSPDPSDAGPSYVYAISRGGKGSGAQSGGGK